MSFPMGFQCPKADEGDRDHERQEGQPGLVGLRVDVPRKRS